MSRERDTAIVEELIKINKNLNQMDNKLAVMEVDLRHHIKRSDKHERWLMTLIVLLAGGAGAGLVPLLPMVKALLP